MSKRRSIVVFEGWLDLQIQSVMSELAVLSSEGEELARKRADQEVRLETLRDVKARIAQLSPGVMVDEEGSDGRV